MLLFARFAYMPNRLGYCGGDANAELLASIREGSGDESLRRHLRAFAGAYPYLRLIADSSGIPDPFHPSVVEAYWIGNDLLERVDWALYARHLSDRFRGQLNRSAMELLVGKPPAGARAHHAFHVFDVSRRTGLPQGDLALDLCRISWGEITAVHPGAFTVSYRPIVTAGGRLAFGDLRPEHVLRPLDADPEMESATVGDLLAFHWRWACVRLSPGQALMLERYTLGMMALANQTF